MSPFEGWDNFYVILGSAAAALLGLTFVVIALMGDRRAHPSGMAGYITPTVVHFGTVLGLSCFVSVPHQNVIGLSIGCGSTALGLLIYTGAIASNLRRFSPTYAPVLEDWIWHVILPAVVYCCCFSSEYTTRGMSRYRSPCKTRKTRRASERTRRDSGQPARQSEGETPVQRRNARMKQLLQEKPRRWVMSLKQYSGELR
jgi:hypothetical protein